MNGLVKQLMDRSEEEARREERGVDGDRVGSGRNLGGRGRRWLGMHAVQ
jgi:hypothetical protein